MARRESPKPASPPLVVLLLAGALSLASALWAGFLWQQLRISRSGGEAFCPLGGDSCADLWDGPFAAAVATLAGVPVAALGVVWGLVAAGLAFTAAWRLRSGGSADPAWSGLACATAIGVASVLGFAGVSLVEGGWCVSCSVTYALVLGVAACVGLGARTAPPTQLVPGGSTAALAAAGLVLAMRLLAPETPPPTARFAPPPEAGAATERIELTSFLAGLAPEEQQRVSDALHQWQQADAFAAEPRALQGSIHAPVQVTVWTDSTCPHCAQYHEGLERLLRIVPPGSVAVAPRVFPLDGACNPMLPKAGDGLRCLLARARLCVETHPGAAAFERTLYEEGAEATEGEVRALATALRGDELEPCLASDETERKLREDVTLASRHGIRGTPFVVINDRRAPASLTLVYALSLAEGDPHHPAFAALPAPREPDPDDPHAGHGH